jgi:hypothetical protein
MIPFVKILTEFFFFPFFSTQHAIHFRVFYGYEPLFSFKHNYTYISFIESIFYYLIYHNTYTRIYDTIIQYTNRRRTRQDQSKKIRYLTYQRRRLNIKIGAECMHKYYTISKQKKLVIYCCEPLHNEPFYNIDT